MYGFGIFAMLFVIFLVYVFYAYSRIFWSATVRYSTFNKVADNVYLDDALENSEAKRLQRLIEQARSRIVNKFGAMESGPVIIIPGSDDNHGKYGLKPHRQSVRAYIPPWGKYLVISSSTQDINLLAHEYFHIEIAERLGYINFKKKLPVWLDEGLALQVDEREPYQFDVRSIDKVEIDRVKTLNHSTEFFTGNNEQIIKNMRAAKAAAFEILNRHSGTSVYDLFSRVRKGEDIADVFNYKKEPAI